MIGLLRTYLRPYGTQLAAILVLLLVGAIGNLYLPDLNGDIINNGVVKGDTDYIVRVGGFMLLITVIVRLMINSEPRNTYPRLAQLWLVALGDLFLGLLDHVAFELDDLAPLFQGLPLPLRRFEVLRNIKTPSLS